MRISVENLANRLLPEKLAIRLHPVMQKVDAILTSDDDSAHAQRMALIVFSIRVASAVIAFVSQVMLARWLGTFQYGIFVAVWVVLIIAGSIASIGFSSAIRRLIAEYRQKNQPEFLRGSIHASVLISLIASLIMALTGALLLHYVPEVVETYYIAPIFIALVCLPVLAVEGVMDGAAQAFNWPYLAFLPTFIMRPLGILAIMGIILLLGYQADAQGAMWAAALSTLISASFQFFAIKTKINKSVPIARPKYHLKVWSLIALPMLLAEGFYALQTSVDIMLVSAYLTPEDTAVYFASTKILALVHFVYFAVRSSAAHRFTAFHHSGDIEGFRQFVQKTVTWTFWPSLTLAAVMMLLGKYFLMLFGAEFVSGQYVIWILAVGIVIRSSIGPAESLLAMADGQTICAAIYAASLFVNISLNIMLIQMYGLAGAAIATTVALTFESVALHVIVKRKLGIHAFIIPQRNTASGGAT